MRFLTWMVLMAAAGVEGSGGGGGGGAGGAAGGAGGDDKSLLGGAGGGGAGADFVKPDGTFSSGWTEAAGVHKSLERFKTVGEFSNAYRSLEAKLGSDKLPVPKDDNDVDGWNAVYTKLGRPADAKGYAFKRPDTVAADLISDATVDTFKAWAHEAGLSEKQAGKIFDKYATSIVEQVAAHDQQQREAVETAKAELHKEWKGNFESFRQLAINTAFKLGGQELLKNPAISNDPQVLKVFYEVGRYYMNEAPPIVSGKTAADDIPAQLAELDKADSPRFNVNHPDHAKANAQYLELLKLAERYGINVAGGR